MNRPILWIFLLCVGAMALPNLASSPAHIEEVLQSQQERVESDPRNPSVWNDLGNLLVLEGRLHDGENAYRQALALAPSDSAIRFNLAVLLQQMRRTDEAESELDQVLGMEPYHAWAHYQLGVIHAGRRDREQALEHYARALAYDPELSFSENNPHILDNPLFSEALILSGRYLEPSATRIPRQYSEPDRIVNMMLKEEEKAQMEAAGSGDSEEDDEGEEDPGEEDPGEEDEGEEGVPRRRGSGGARASFEDSAAPATAGQPAAGDREDSSRQNPPPAPSGTTTGTLRRVPPTSADPTSADPAGRQVTANVPPDSSSSRNPTLRNAPPPRTHLRANPTRRDSQAADPQDRESVQRTPPPPTPPRSRSGSRYIPSSRSTSQLELKLLPEEQPVRYARLEPKAIR